MDPDQALDYLCEAAQRGGAEAFDALAGDSSTVGVELYEGKVKNTEIATSRGVGIRLFKNGRPGYAFTEKFSTEALSQTVEDALSHTLLTDPLDIEFPLPRPLPEVDLQLWNPALEEVGLDDMKSLGLELESLARQGTSEVENVPYLGVGRTSGHTRIRNSRGLDFGTRANSMQAGLGVVAARGQSRKLGVYSNRARDAGDFKPGIMAARAVERAVELLGAGPIAGGKYPVVFSNRISPQIMGMYSACFFAEAVQKGQSKLEGKVGQTIAAGILHLRSDPHRPGWPGSRLFDGEGVVCAPMEVVRAGVLAGFLYNLESAKREGRASTGHATRGYSGQAGTGFANLVVDPGPSTLEELLSAHPKCLLVTQLEGGSGCSAISGELSIGAQGFLIADGARVAPVEGVTLNTNFFDLIGNLQGVSDSWSDALSATKVPDLLVDSVYVAG